MNARVVRMAVEHRQGSGAYERLSGHFIGELDPVAPLNAIINDLRLAPRNARAQVEYRATFTLLLPADAKASGVLWYEVPNPGGSPLNPRPHGGWWSSDLCCQKMPLGWCARPSPDVLR